MFKNKIQILIFIFFILISFQNLQAQLSKKHYLPPITSDDPIENQYIYISTPKNQNIGFKIIPIGQPETSIINGTVSNMLSYSTSATAIGNQLFQDSNSTSVITSNRGYIIEADDVIYVSVRMRSQNGFQAGAIVSKGSSALGNNFRVGGFVNTAPVGGHLNFVSVMATEDDTNVIFDDLNAGITINNYSGTLPINITLDEGETYIVSVSVDTGGDPNDLIGALVNSDKPIVVNSGSATGTFDIAPGRDYGMDQIVDASKVGTEYIFVKGDGDDRWENVLIVAHENNTEIRVGNNTTPIATINRGQSHVIEGGFYNANGNMYVETSKPAFAYQGIGSGGNAANQGLFFVPPLSCENRGDVNNIAEIDAIGSDAFTGGITIVTNKGADVNINGLPIASFTTSGPFDVDGNANYETYRVSNLNNNVTVTSSEELYCAYFNFNGFATSGGFYSGFPSAPEINFTANVMSLGNCVPNLTLDAANTDLFDSFEWLYDDGNGAGFASTGITTSNFNPTLPGKYKLVGLINCSGLTFESAEVPVSLCPDDFDGDTVIDNIDVDIDNDGILNTDESIGDAVINISSTSNPSITFQDSSTNSAIISSTFSETNSSGTANTLTGDTTGNFVSTINAGNISSLNYELNFTEDINFKFTQAAGIPHMIANGEFFIIKIGPNNKNITLVDPDDQLLVDTNFDGVFEAGVTEISASEIHFAYNPTPTGTTSFQFVANQINQVIFEHNSISLATTSTFNGNFLLTSFTKDSDGDGIEDMLDLDSDNDGIPDIIETTNQNTILLNTDADFNGLDDIFETVTVNQDSDNDGVLNYLDLDSDNDGIYDLAEAGHIAADANLDGRIDNANATNVGINGLLDALETATDNRTLSYTIADTDADSNFNFLELDADNDNCNDVTEAGFTDQNNDGILGTVPVQVDADGKVINAADGYTNPNANYITSAPITINTPFVDVAFCEAATEDIIIDTTADAFQWQVSTNNGGTWNNITNNAIYSGSASNTLKITNISLTFNNHQFKVLLNRTGNSCQEESNPIILTVNPLPIIKTNPVVLKQCDDNADLITTFNLTEAQISISDNNANETFQYFATEADAIAGTPLVVDELRYPVTANGDAWVRTISQFGCYEISKIELVVSFAGNVAYDKEFIECDDFLDISGNNTAANSDIDGVSTFNFNIARQEVLNLFPALIQPNLEVNFYETIADRTASINEIPDISNHRNNSNPTFANNQTIYMRIKNTVNNDCTGIGELFLTVNSVPSENTVLDLNDCDNIDDGDSLNGIIQTFDLDGQTATILGSQNAVNFTVTYHDSAANANSGNSPLASPFTNTIRDNQTIFVRVTNNTTGCFTDHTTFNLIISPVPNANFVNDLEVCDDNTDGSARNGFSQIIDLESQTAGILGTQDPSIYSVTYHRSFAEAQSGATPLISPYTNSIPNRETIYIRVYDMNTMCQNGISNFDVIVNPEPIFETTSNLSYCDDTNDGDDTNGIIQTIDLDSQIPLLLGATQDPDDFNVTFHANQTEATSGASPIPSPYTNTNATETIFVRIQNKATSCVNDDTTFEVIINALPDFSVTTPQILCLNDLPLNISAERPNKVYTYEWRDLNGNLLGTNQDFDVATSGTYNITATTTNGTNCTRTRTIVVNESNTATLENSFITIIDESNNIGSENSLSISINTTDNDLGPGDYQFAVLNNDNQDRFPSIGFQDEPLFENLEGGVYTIIVNDKNGCSPDTELLVSVIQFPKFFTPNGDGENDTWIVKGANKTFYPNSSINIFNRYGKLVAQISIDKQGWDGTYNGKVLFSDDYWFNVTLIPADLTKPMINKKGNFSLLRK